MRSFIPVPPGIRTASNPTAARPLLLSAGVKKYSLFGLLPDPSQANAAA
jgi:hypothetical protein